jgi:hypothetical protein
MSGPLVSFVDVLPASTRLSPACWLLIGLVSSPDLRLLLAGHCALAAAHGPLGGRQAG